MAAGDLSASRVDVDRAGGGRYDTLQNYVDAKTVKVNYRSSYTATPANADVVLLDASVVPGNLAVGMATTQGNGEVIVEELPGAVGTGLASVLTDEDGGYLNMVEVRDSATNDPIMTADDSTGRTVYGVLQCANAVADGAAIGAAAAENLQLSFVYFDENDALQLFAVNQAIQFGVPVVRMLRNRSPLALDEGVTMADIAGSDPVEQSRWHTRRIDITANAGAGVTINVDTAALTGGTGGTAVVSTPYAEAVELGADATEFLARRVLINGRRVGNDTLTWVSATEFTWTGELYQGDQVWVEEWKVPAAALVLKQFNWGIAGIVGTTADFTLLRPITGLVPLVVGTAGSTHSEPNPGGFGPDAASFAANVVVSVAGVPAAAGTDVVWLSPDTITVNVALADSFATNAFVITTPYGTA